MITDPGGQYSYTGTQMHVQQAVLSLSKAQVNSGHVAVWLGAQHGDQSWIQAGIQSTYGNTPRLYMEIGHQNGAQQFVSLGPYRLGHPVNVKVINVNGTYSVVVNGRQYGKVYLGNDAYTTATGESYETEGKNVYKYGIKVIRSGYSK